MNLENPAHWIPDEQSASSYTLSIGYLLWGMALALILGHATELE
jgi:hypothetical protein